MEDIFMSGRTMSNVREKLSKSRERCPGLSEELYALTDYMAKTANDELVPQGMAMCLLLSMDDIRKERYSFLCGVEFKEKLEYLTTHKEQVFEQAIYVPQVIDAIADKDFSNEFRRICKEMLNFDSPQRDEKFNENEEIDNNYPDYVHIAVNWWANVLVSPKFGKDDIANEGMAFLMTSVANSKNSISKEQLSVFKEELAQLIVAKMKSSLSEDCNLSVTYNPDKLLFTAARKAGISVMSFPWKTNMHISKEVVSVLTESVIGRKTLWKKA